MKNKTTFFLIITCFFFTIFIHAQPESIFDHDESLEKKIQALAHNYILSDILYIRQEGYKRLYYLAVLKNMNLPISKYVCNWIESTLDIYINSDSESINEIKKNNFNQDLENFIKSGYKKVFSSQDVEQEVALALNVLYYKIMLLKKIDLPIQKVFIDWISKKIIHLNAEDKKILQQNFSCFCIAQQRKQAFTSVPQKILTFLEQQKKISIDTCFMVLSGLYDEEGKDLFEKFNTQLKTISLSQEHIEYSMALSAIAFTLAIPKLKISSSNRFDMISLYNTYLKIYKKLCFIVENKKDLSTKDFGIKDNDKQIQKDQIEYILYQATQLGFITTDQILAVNNTNQNTIDTIFSSIQNPDFFVFCDENHKMMHTYFALKQTFDNGQEAIKQQELSELHTIAKSMQQEKEQIKNRLHQAALSKLTESNENERTTAKHVGTLTKQSRQKALASESIKTDVSFTANHKPTVPRIPQTNSKPKLSAASLKRIEKEAFELQQQAQQELKTISNKQLKKIKTNLLKEEENKRTSLITESNSSFTLITLLKKLSKDHVTAYSAIKNQEINGRKALTAKIENALQELEQAKQDDVSSTSTTPAEPLLSVSQDLTSLHHTSPLSPIKQHNPYAIRVLPELTQQREETYEFQQSPTCDWYDYQINKLHQQIEQRRLGANMLISKTSEQFSLCEERIYNKILELEQERNRIYYQPIQYIQRISDCYLPALDFMKLPQ